MAGEIKYRLLRFFLGLGFGVILTVYSFAFVGVGHGTFVPMVFTASLIALITNWGAIPTLLLAPLLWAFYLLLLPKIEKIWTRITVTVAVLSLHVLSCVVVSERGSSLHQFDMDQYGRGYFKNEPAPDGRCGTFLTASTSKVICKRLVTSSLKWSIARCGEYTHGTKESCRNCDRLFMTSRPYRPPRCF